MQFIDYCISHSSQETKFIDFGAGKGYLSAHLAFDRERVAYAVEASERHAISFAKRMYLLGNTNPKKKQLHKLIGNEISAE